MYFQSIAYVMVLMAATLTSGVVVPGGLPDGNWSGKQYLNGTTVTTSLSDPTIPPIIEHHEFIPNNIHTRGSGSGDCWGYQLDPASVDEDNRQLQAEVGTLGYNFCSDSQNAWFGWIVNSVLVYYCIDVTYECTVINAELIREGMGFMDDICAPYEAGWALDASESVGSRFLMGKCVINSNICV